MARQVITEIAGFGGEAGRSVIKARPNPFYRYPFHRFYPFDPFHRFLIPSPSLYDFSRSHYGRSSSSLATMRFC